MTEVIVTATFDAMDADEADRIEQALRVIIAELHPANVVISRRERVK